MDGGRGRVKYQSFSVHSAGCEVCVMASVMAPVSRDLPAVVQRLDVHAKGEHDDGLQQRTS